MSNHFFFSFKYRMNVSEKSKKYLNKKLEDCQQKLIKLKRKRKLNKTLYIVTVLLSIITSAVVSVISSMTIVPVIVISVLAAFSAILTGISARFNFHDKKTEIKSLIDKLNKIKAKIEFVISCNGDLLQDDYEQILKEFNV
jgi:SMODS and SLOG-associating 2TM effector domain